MTSMTVTTIGTLGVMCCSRPGTPPLSEEGFCRRLSLVAPKYGLNIIAFCPQDVLNTEVKIQAYVYKQGQWVNVTVPFPDIVYDRCLFRKDEDLRAAAKLMSQVSKHKPWIVWSRGLPGKWQIYRTLKKDIRLLPYLPPTSLYQGAASLKQNLAAMGTRFFSNRNPVPKVSIRSISSMTRSSTPTLFKGEAQIILHLQKSFRTALW